MKLQIDSLNAIMALPSGTVSQQAMQTGLLNDEPLLIGLDCLLRYAIAYRLRYGAQLKNDGFLGPAWLQAAVGFEKLLNGDGAVAMEKSIATDSKDNGALEKIFLAAMAQAGFNEKDL